MEQQWEEFFRGRKINEIDEVDLEIVRSAFCVLAGTCQNRLRNGRYKALVLTKLEEAAAFATKSFSHG